MLDFVRNYWFLFVVVIGVIIVVIFNQERNQFEDNEEDLFEQWELSDLELDNQNEEKEELELEIKWYVDVKGEVQRPGLYEVTQNTRVKNVIDLAGGFTDDAAEELINLAQKVTDEMVIYVPKKGEESELNIVMHTTVGGETATESEKVKINEATAEELTKLNGIGPSKAEAIITYREEHGPFNEVDDLLQVSGIGEKTLENIRDDVIVP